VDWWAFGILIYEFLVGQPPFWDQNPMKIYEQIVEGKVRYPSAMSEDARDIIGGLCTVDVSKRLGNVKGGAATVKSHPWFKNINWDDLYHRKMQGPIVPHLRSADDTRNFDDYDPEPETREPYTKVCRWHCLIMRDDADNIPRSGIARQTRSYVRRLLIEYSDARRSVRTHDRSETIAL
jgi:serine/threonine protein kinase